MFTEGSVVFDVVQKNCGNRGDYQRKRQELTEDTDVRQPRQLNQVTVTLVLHALVALDGRVAFACTVNVKRSQGEHRHIDCQEQPGGYLSLQPDIHGAKLQYKFEILKLLA